MGACPGQGACRPGIAGHPRERPGGAQGIRERLDVLRLPVNTGLEARTPGDAGVGIRGMFEPAIEKKGGEEAETPGPQGDTETRHHGHALTGAGKALTGGSRCGTVGMSELLLFGVSHGFGGCASCDLAQSFRSC
jgi:hypothetical protein